jgi:membrane-associated phospholipid phosphatase
VSRRLAAIDMATIAYMACASLAYALRWPKGRPFPWLVLAAHAALAGLAAVAPRLRARGGGASFLGDLYPLLAVFGLYREIGFLNTAAGAVYDDAVLRWEALVFGGQPSLAWIRAWPWPALSWPLHLGYLSYYLLLAAPPAVWLSGRREGARQVVALTMTAFYLCYVVFLFFPVAGPRYLFPRADNPATRLPIVALIHRLLAGGSSWGTAFPSSHVAAGLTVALATFRACRPLGVALLPLALLLSLGTVYGQFHYALDALAGAAVAGVVYAFRRRLAGP